MVGYHLSIRSDDLHQQGRGKRNLLREQGFVCRGRGSSKGGCQRLLRTASTGKDSRIWLQKTVEKFFFILGGEDQAKVCYVDFVLGSADTGDRLRCHLLDHRHQELPLQLPHGRGRRRGGEFSVVGSWPDRGAGGSLWSSLLVDLPKDLF